VVATAGTLAARVRAAGLEAPGVVVVGSVVTLRERIAWFEERPLFGRRIVVTRPRAQAGALAAQLEAKGAEVIPFPTIAIAPPSAPVPRGRSVASAAGSDWIVFTSANGVEAFFAPFAAARRDVREWAAAITFTSSSTVRSFAALLGRPATARLLANGRPAVACIGPVTAATARDLGLRVDVMPAAYTAAALAAALVQHFGKAAA